MKAADLMIGDWVYNSYHKKNIKWNYSEMFCPNGIPVIGRDLKPIPLTPEILEKNGWKETQYWHEYQDGKNTIQCCLPDMRGIINGIEIEHFKCEYVHQYQHLLRLCGLDELADNFKV